VLVSKLGPLVTPNLLMLVLLLVTPNRLPNGGCSGKGGDENGILCAMFTLDVVGRKMLAILNKPYSVEIELARRPATKESSNSFIQGIAFLIARILYWHSLVSV
jgi:hypothetical protein